MSFTFADLVEEIRHRPMEEKVEIKEILEHDLIHTERERMYQNHLESMREWEGGKIVSARDVDDLIRRLEAE
jgi:hypothetical protein